MSEQTRILEEPAARRARGIVERYRAVPLYLRILLALAVGLVLGLLLGERAEPLKWVSRIVLRILGAIAPALILVAVIDSILNANVKGRSAAKMAFLLVLNTTVAIFIGLAVANILRPGKHEQLAAPQTAEPAPTTGELGEQLLENIPKSVLEPLVNNNV